MQSFCAEHVPLDEGTPGWGTVALLPWDAEIFGFAVGDWRPGDAQEIAGRQAAFAERLARWAAERGVELVGCRLPAPAWQALSAGLSEAGFRFVEASVSATLAPLTGERLPRARIAVRRAVPEDSERLLAIAGSAFDTGRYHAEPRLPRGLADSRYRFWLNNALSRPTAGTRVFAIGEPGRPIGFFHVEVDEDAADLRLGAVDAQSNPGVAGYALYSGVLCALAAEGVRRVEARCSATNTAVVNLYAALSFRFSSPEIVMHWHSPTARHLLPMPGSAAELEEVNGQAPAR